MIPVLLLGWALAAGLDPATVVGPPANPAPAADQVEAITHAVGKLMRCPVCQGLSVSDSPSESAQEMKAEVRALVVQGYDQEQILEYFETSYGEFIRLEPKREGWNLLVWAAPAAAVLAGLGFVGWRIRSAGRTAPPPPPPVSDAVVAPDDDPDLLPYLQRVRALVGPPR